MNRVYFIGPWGFKALKIGFTAKPWRSRLTALQIGNHEELRLYALIEGDERLELDLHARFARHHIRGEWFRHAGDLRKFTDSLAETAIFHRMRGGALP